MKTFVLDHTRKLEALKCLCLPKICICPPSHVVLYPGAGPDSKCSIIFYTVLSKKKLTFSNEQQATSNCITEQMRTKCSFQVICELDDMDRFVKN